MKNKLNIIRVIITAIIALTIMFFIQAKSLAAQEMATVNVETANLRETGDSNSKILELLSQGQKVEIIEKEGQWYKVKKDNITGYLREDLVKVEETVASQETQTNQEQNNTENTNNEQTNNAQNEETNNVQNEEETNSNEQEENQEQKNENQEELSLGKYKISQNIQIKIIPSINAKVIQEIEQGQEVEITENINGWLCVETMEEKGWIRKEKISVQENSSQEEQPTSNEQQPEEQEQNNEQETQPEQTEETNNNQSTTKTLYVKETAINVREKPSKDSEVLLSLYLNEEVEVVSEENGWYKVKVKGIEGYISSSLLSETKQQTSRGLETPRKESEINNQENEQTDTSASTAPTNTASTGVSGAEVVAKAKSYIGSRYVYGGTSPSGFDCSGFTQYIYNLYGINLNRTAQEQYSNGVQVARADLQEGDIILFGSSASAINHVGIYIGGGSIVHAANATRGVVTDTINSGYYNTNYVGARRVL